MITSDRLRAIAHEQPKGSRLYHDLLALASALDEGFGHAALGLARRQVLATDGLERRAWQRAEALLVGELARRARCVSDIARIRALAGAWAKNFLDGYETTLWRRAS